MHDNLISSRAGLLAKALVTLALIIAAPVVRANPNLSDWKFGSAVSGDRPGKSDLKNKVVVLEYWGVHCPPCIAAMPHLAKLYKMHAGEGLVVIGAESQNSSDQEIRKVIEKAGVTYPIVSGATGPIPVAGLPRAFVFGHDGELVWDGHPMGVEFGRAVDRALEALDKSGLNAKDKPVAASNALLIPFRAWTNADGKSINAAVKRVTDATVTFLMPNCSEIAYPLEKLSKESRAVLAGLKAGPWPRQATDVAE